MPDIPRAVCLKCKKPFKPEKNGVTMRAHSKLGYYYSIQVDKWKCPQCGQEILVGFADQPTHFNYQGKMPKATPGIETVDIRLE